MPTKYTVELTPAEIAALIQMATLAELQMMKATGSGFENDEAGMSAYMKISDAQQQYYDDNNIPE